MTSSLTSDLHSLQEARTSVYSSMTSFTAGPEQPCYSVGAITQWCVHHSTASRRAAPKKNPAPRLQSVGVHSPDLRPFLPSLPRH